MTDYDNTQDQDQEDQGVAGITNLDFNVDDEFKPDPLIPKGTYHGVVTKVTYNSAQCCIVWDICLHDNGGVMSDSETPIDGAHTWYRNWLPKPGDESIPTTSGRTNKRQSKINMLRDFANALCLDMSTPRVIAQSIEEAQWIGIEVDVDIDIDEYQGKFRNQANRVRKSTMY